MAKWLVEKGADVNLVCEIGTAVHNCIEYGDRDLLDFLIKHGGPKSLRLVDNRGFTPLILAASIGRDEFVSALVNDYKEDVDQQREVTPLLMATQNRCNSTVTLLMSMHANPDIQHPQMNCTALHLAASNEFADIVDALLKSGANVDCQDPRGYTPLLMAGTEGYTGVVKQLIEGGADVNHRAHSDNTTAIFHCANKDRVEVVRILLDHGADQMSTQFEDNMTIAIYARKEGRVKMANLLDSYHTVAPELRNKLCHLCYVYHDGQMKRCTRCKKVWYCSQECQKTDWGTHKISCKPAQ